jgi:hypothetical protein
VKREIKYQPPKIAVHSVEQNERIRRMVSHLDRKKEKFKQGVEQSAHLGVEANGVLAGPTRSSKK